MDLRFNSQRIREVYITSDKPAYELKRHNLKTSHSGNSNLMAASLAWMDYPFRSSQLKNVCLFEFVQNFTKIGHRSYFAKHNADPNNYFPFQEGHPQYETFGMTMLHPNKTFAVNILPYNRYVDVPLSHV
jgi:hypothetical protein